MLIETDYRALLSAGQDGLPLAAAESVVAIGNFDGVHLGHRALLAEGKRIAAEKGWRLTVLTFSPHPRGYFRPTEAPHLLTDAVQKREALFAAGADAVVELKFDILLADLDPEQFVRNVLVDGLLVRHVVVGDDFHFGKRRAGNAGTLALFGKLLNFGVTPLGQVQDVQRQRFSSERIRAALRSGHMFSAAELLGRPWQIRGEVVTGQQRGRTIGFPTANIALENYVRPLYGVYAARVSVEGRDGRHDAVLNLGERPTFGVNAPNLEVHLLDYAGDLYGQTLRVDMLGLIRAERKFDGLDDLKAQIARDVVHAREKIALEDALHAL